MRRKETVYPASAFKRMVAQKQGVRMDAPPEAPKESPLEVMFDELWKEHDVFEPVREYLFCEGRKWRFDFAWPYHYVAAEMDGGQHSSFGGGRHNSDSDRRKLNKAAALGWRVLRFSRAMLQDYPEECMAMVKEALELDREL